MKRVYIGPHSEVELASLGVLVKQGEAVEVDAELAALLDEQPSNWSKSTTAKEAQS